LSREDVTKGSYQISYRFQSKAATTTCGHSIIKAEDSGMGAVPKYVIWLKLSIGVYPRIAILFKIEECLKKLPQAYT
jgi:hypothetical protein